VIFNLYDRKNFNATLFTGSLSGCNFAALFKLAGPPQDHTAYFIIEESGRPEG